MSNSGVPKMLKRTVLKPARALSTLLAFGAGALVAGLACAQGVPKGATNAATTGFFGPVVSWPLMPIHVAVLPDGRVMSYGTNAAGVQGAQFNYDVWDPRLGTGMAAHLVLPNATGTDIFCSAQSLLPASGRLLITGGDVTVGGVRNHSSPDVNVFDYNTNVLSDLPQARMSVPRWYPSLLTLANGETLLMGGLANPTTAAPTPEVYTLNGQWRVLSGATSQDAYGTANAYYPRGWQAPNGRVFILGQQGATFSLDPSGVGAVSKLALTLPAGQHYLPAVMYAPGKILTLRKNNRAFVVDINGMTPAAATVNGVGQDRYNATATVMADGKVVVSGGSMFDNTDFGVARTLRIWNPASRAWSNGPMAKQKRLYHSVSMLLPDATVLTGGGGAPGPQTNLNAEIFYPPYLYKKDGSGLPATRPMISQAPSMVTWNTAFSVQSSSPISRVTLVRAGSVTHTVDFDQRFMDLSFTPHANAATVTAPASPNLAPPGFYMLFVFDAAGVPSVAAMLRIG
jgi:Domain of unknown function (DUF1929)